MKIIVYGANGKMGQAVVTLAQNGFAGASIAAAVDRSFTAPDETHLCALPENRIDADVLVDFSNHACIREIAAYAERCATPAVIATTGQTEEEQAIIDALAKKVPVFLSANMSMGIALLIELAKKTAAAFPDADIEIIEKHHAAKLDAPSGTALMIANAIKSIRESAAFAFGRSGRRQREKNEIGIHAVRAGSIVGEHEVIVATNTEIVTLKHEAQSRTVFAEGALHAAAFLCTKSAGLYDMRDMIGK